MKEEWHLSKGISISHITTTIILIVSVALYVGDIKKDVAIQKNEINNIRVTIDSTNKRHYEMFNTINRKLDKLFQLIYQKRN